MKFATIASIAAPSFGPAVVTLFGQDVPVLAMTLSGVGLLLARYIAPPPLRKLTKKQEVALTALLMLILFLIVTGSIGTGEPLGVGMSVVWAISLGLSGLVAVEKLGDRVNGNKEG